MKVGDIVEIVKPVELCLAFMIGKIGTVKWISEYDDILVIFSNGGTISTTAQRVKLVEPPSTF